MRNIIYTYDYMYIPSQFQYTWSAHLLTISLSKAMSHRVYLKNLSFAVSKGPLFRALHGHGITLVSHDDILIVRKGRGAGCKECSAFLTFQSDDEVTAAVSCLNGRVLGGCSRRPVAAEKAVPRITTLSQTTSSDPYQEIDECQLGITTTDDTSADLSSGSRGVAAVHRNMKVKQEEHQTSDLKPSSTGAKRIQQFVKEKKEFLTAPDPEPQEKPWHRRKRLRGENN